MDWRSIYFAQAPRINFTRNGVPAKKNNRLKRMEVEASSGNVFADLRVPYPEKGWIEPSRQGPTTVTHKGKVQR